MTHPRQPQDQDKVAETSNEQVELAKAQALLAQVRSFSEGFHTLAMRNIKSEDRSEKEAELKKEWDTFVDQLQTQIRDSNNSNISRLYDQAVVHSIEDVYQAIREQGPPIIQTMENFKEDEILSVTNEGIAVPSPIKPAPPEVAIPSVVHEELHFLNEFPSPDEPLPDEETSAVSVSYSTPPPEIVASFQCITLTPAEEANPVLTKFLEEMNSIVVPSHKPHISMPDRIDAGEEERNAVNDMLSTSLRNQVDAPLTALKQWNEELNKPRDSQRNKLVHKPSSAAPQGQLSSEMNAEKIQLQILLKEQILALEKLEKQRIFKCFPANSKKAELLKTLKGLDEGLKNCYRSDLLTAYGQTIKSTLDLFALRVGENNPSKQSSLLVSNYKKDAPKLAALVDNLVTQRNGGAPLANASQDDAPAMSRKSPR